MFPSWANFKDRIRYAARRRLPKLLELHSHKCFWCGVPLVNHSRLPAGVLLVRMTGNKVYWVEGGFEKSCHFATVDHLKEIANGGRNAWDNLVPSCRSCNTKRTNKPKSFRKQHADHPFFAKEREVA